MRLKPILAYLAAIAFLALFVSAGFWQLRRAQEKDLLFAAWANVEQLPTVPFEQARKLPVGRDHLVRTELSGHYLPGHNVLLDNQQQDGEVGVQVYTPFLIDGATDALLVDRGFLAVPRDRSSFPDPVVPADDLTVRGLLVAPPAAGLRLGAAVVADHWPLLVIAIETKALGEALAQPLLPSVLLLDPHAPEGFARDWQLHTLSPERHRGYAVQWFGLAATLLIITAIFTFRRRRIS